MLRVNGNGYIIMKVGEMRILVKRKGGRERE